MIKTNQYPINFDEIEKGDILSLEMLETITAEKAGTDKFIFKVLSLQGKISDETGYTVKSHDNTLIVLTDEAASNHNDRLFKRFKRGMFQRHALMQNVDIAQLSDTAKIEHERKVLNQSRYISALKAPKRFTVEIEKPKELIEVKAE